MKKILLIVLCLLMFTIPDLSSAQERIEYEGGITFKNADLGASKRKANRTRAHRRAKTKHKRKKQKRNKKHVKRKHRKGGRRHR